jgi:purine catabolism regulator
MRSRLPAFESVRGGELALLTLPQLRRLDETLPHLLKSLHQEGVAAVAVAAPSIDALANESCTIADQLHLPLILLPPTAPLEEIEREVITFVVSFRGEIERKASEISHALMQLSIQGAGMQGVCNHLAASCHKWVIIQDADHQIRSRAAPTPSTSTPKTITLPTIINDDTLWQHDLTRIMAPILIRHEIVGYLSLIGDDNDFDYLERIILGQVAPILALEFAREKERSEVESRYQLEAFMDVLQGNYQQPDEMLARARLLGYDLTTPQVVTVFGTLANESDDTTGGFQAQWSRRVREELLRAWPTGWILAETSKVTAILPLNQAEIESAEADTLLLARLERVHTRLQQNQGFNGSLPAHSIGLGRAAPTLAAIPQSLREAQQALEIGRRLFGENKLHSFAHLGIYRLLFHLNGQSELTEFYTEMLGPLLQADTRADSTLLETLEGFFRCNGNLSETARVMHLHRNSLLYRLGRIEEILGRSLDDSELRLSLQIALKIHHLLKT